MYFIRNGRFSVHVKKEHLKAVSMDDEKRRPDTYLIDGDHFGEIGLLFDGKRTCTVKSDNYGTLAKLTKSDFVELSKTFETFQAEFKNQIFKY